MDVPPPIPQGGHRRPVQPHRRTRDAQEGDSPTMTRVAIGENGMLKVRTISCTCRARCRRSERVGTRPRSDWGHRRRHREPGRTRRDADAERDGIHGSGRFIAYPEEEEDDEEGDEGDTYEDGL